MAASRPRLTGAGAGSSSSVGQQIPEGIDIKIIHLNLEEQRQRSVNDSEEQN
jgi:hypothetical protein